MEIASKFRLGQDVRLVISEVKTEFRTGNKFQKLKEHEGRELANIVFAKRGSELLEYRVGRAHAGDPRPAGSRRIVLLFQHASSKLCAFSARLSVATHLHREM